MSLPAFKYHPDPVATGAVSESSETCACCGQARGYVYEGAVYGDKDIGGALCPWCIADGSAASKFGASFSDESALESLPKNIVEEVTRRTPGFLADSEAWLICCDDSCAYHGDAPRAELEALSGDDLQATLEFLEWDAAKWKNFVASYATSEATMHKFQCLHCGDAHYMAEAA
jgi:uncharacterized protein CbrC (UPF0167 family)